MTDKKKITRRDLLRMSIGAGAGFAMARLGARIARAQESAPQGAPGKMLEANLPQVPRRVLGKTGETVPILLFGGGVDLDARFDPKLAEAQRFGVNYIDAADCYGGGTCEANVGSFLAKADARKNTWITSKSDDWTPKGFESTLNRGLERMGTDYFDLYFLHALDTTEPVNDELKATVARLKKEGKIRFFGFSCHDGNVAELLHLAAKTPWIDSVMFRYNFAQYGDKELNNAIDAAHKANVGLIAMKTQRSEVGFRDAWQKFEQKGPWNKHQAVLKAVWADDRISAAVSHMDTFDKLKENIAAAVDQFDLGAAEWDALRNYADATRGMACDGCDHICNAAVEAPVRIGATLRYLMYHDSYGETARARELYQKLPAAARRIDGVDFRGANAACPLGVDVAGLMKRAHDVLA